MGVLYRACDDVPELLVPFVADHNGAGAHEVEAAYLRASLGESTASQFWAEVGLDPAIEDAYLKRHELADGVIAFLEWARTTGYSLACLSNDVAEWSLKLRKAFGLDRFISEWVISGDVHLRKPDPRIYAELLRRVGRDPGELVFIDDRIRNIDAARTAGLRTVLLSRDGTQSEHACARSLGDVRALLTTSAILGHETTK